LRNGISSGAYDDKDFGYDVWGQGIGNTQAEVDRLLGDLEGNTRAQLGDESLFSPQTAFDSALGSPGSIPSATTGAPRAFLGGGTKKRYGQNVERGRGLGGSGVF
jgi:hypothetical protein